MLGQTPCFTNTLLSAAIPSLSPDIFQCTAPAHLAVGFQALMCPQGSWRVTHTFPEQLLLLSLDRSRVSIQLFQLQGRRWDWGIFPLCPLPSLSCRILPPSSASRSFAELTPHVLAEIQMVNPPRWEMFTKGLRMWP